MPSKVGRLQSDLSELERFLKNCNPLVDSDTLGEVRDSFRGAVEIMVDMHNDPDAGESLGRALNLFVAHCKEWVLQAQKLLAEPLPDLEFLESSQALIQASAGILRRPIFVRTMNAPTVLKELEHLIGRLDDRRRDCEALPTTRPRRRRRSENFYPADDDEFSN